MVRGFGKGFVFGSRKTKKQKKREQLARNRAKGKVAEELLAMQYQLGGCEVEKTGKGHDFRIRRRNPFTGKVTESKLVEVKSGKAKLSKLQRTTKKQKRNYKVERIDPPFY